MSADRELLVPQIAEDLKEIVLAALLSCKKWHYEGEDGDLHPARTYDDEAVELALSALLATPSYSPLLRSDARCDTVQPN